MTRNVLGALHQWTNDGSQALYAARDAFKEVFLEGGAIGYDVSFNQAMPLQPRAAVDRPVISIMDPSMTITCATAEAAIYYTVDGSSPSPANAAAALYSGAVDISGLSNGTLIRAAAFKAPLRGSHCARAEV